MLKTTGSSRLSALKAFRAENDEVVRGSGRADETIVNPSNLVEKLSKVKKPQKPEKVAKAIGSEERLPKHQSSIGLWIRKTRATVRTLTVFRALFARPRSSLNTISN